VERAGDSGFLIELVFLFLTFFGKFCGEELLRCLFCAFVPHSSVSQGAALENHFTLAQIGNRERF
jgi:hypothetical protein